jgi:acyl-CoA reductase-like NAD-dependent aldehyde dehydrogenase
LAKFSLTIDGRAAEAESTFPVINPVDETLVAQCPQGTVEHLEQAIAAARAAFTAWSRTSDAIRVAKLRRIADLLEQHASELSELLTLEQGKPQSGPGANVEVSGAVAWTRVTAGLSLPDEIIQDDASRQIVVRRKPVGVVASITPWNWPLLIAVWHVMPALRVGCTVLVKPSPYTPLATLRLVEIMNSVLPPGVINTVTGDAEMGAAIVAHHGINKIVFTGSVGTGKGIMRSAADTLKRLTLELGGNDAGIVLPATTIEPLLEKLFWGCFTNSGQTCAALKRLYVHESQYEQFVSTFAKYVSAVPVGDGMNPKNLIGPLTNRLQLDRLSGYVEEARLKGGRVVTGGVRPKGSGFFYPLTIVADASDDMKLVKEEQFGTAIPILRYSTVEEAIERANSLEFGLGGSVWGNDLNEAAGVASQLECGTAWVNQHGSLHPLAPFGGVKCSGLGVEFNVDGLKEYTAIQVLNVAR